MRTKFFMLASAASLTPFTSAVAQTSPAPVSAASTAEQASDGSQGLADIVVTAQKRSQSLQTVPVAVTAIESEQLQNQRVNTFTDLARVVPNITVSEATGGPSSTIALRGVGTFAISIGVESSVAFVIDDVPALTQAQAFANLNDIEQVEILRGPQGTLFGKGASAGVINVTTQAPSSTMTGSFRTQLTTDRQRRFQGSISGPLAPAINARLSGFYDKRRGYIDNLTTGSHLGGEESFGFRGRIDVEPIDRLSLNFVADYAKSTTNGVRTFRNVPANGRVFGVDIANSGDLTGIRPGASNYKVRQNYDPSNPTKQFLGQARATYDLGGASLVSITAYQDYRFALNDDLDSLQTDTFLVGVVPTNVPRGALQIGPFHSTQFTQEFRLVSKGSGPLQYVTGLYFADGKTDRQFRRGPVLQLAGWNARFGTKTLAAFGQVDYSLTGSTRLTGGLRVNREKISVDFTNVVPTATPPVNNATCLSTCSGNAADTAVTGKVSLSHDLASRVMVYASFATGYKGQGFDISTGFNPTRAQNPVRPETSKSYELGVKSRFLDNSVQLNVTAFLTDYSDFQAQSIIQLPDSSVQFGLFNVGTLRTKGVEAELTARFDGLRLNGGVAYTDATIRSFPVASCYSGQTAATGCTQVPGAAAGTLAQDLAGKTLANAPKWKASFGARYDFELQQSDIAPYVSIDGQYQSSVLFDLFQNPSTRQDAYTVANGAIGFKNAAQGWDVSLFVNNMFDKHYATLIGPASGGTPFTTVQLVPRNSQRYFGLRASYGF